MMPASTNGGGQIALPGPLDSCKTPTPGGPVPMPYPNLAMLTQLKGGSCSSKVKISGKKTAVKESEIPMSTGDEPGTLGGVVSSRFKGPCKLKAGSGKVKAEGKGIAYASGQSAHNGSNANNPSGVQVAPSQTKVMVSP